MTTFKSFSPELLSALVDGELAGGELVVGIAETGLQGIVQSSSLLSDWNTYHVIGAVLRSSAAASQGADPVFLQRLNLRLADEKIALPVLV